MLLSGCVMSLVRPGTGLQGAGSPSGRREQRVAPREAVSRGGALKGSEELGTS